MTPSIPRRTQSELANPAAPGGCHHQMIRLAMPLLGSGLSPDAVFAELRAKYDRTVTDNEIRGVISWALQKNPKATGFPRYLNSPAPRQILSPTKESAIAAAGRFLKGFKCSEDDLWHASPWRPLEDPALDALPLLAGLFHAGELANICTEYGAGITRSRDEWMAHTREFGAPAGSIGCLFRPNPVSLIPTGDGGGFTDADVTAHRFAVVESDLLPLELQLAVIAKLPLPIAAIIFSGGKSYHALVRVDAQDSIAYRKDVSKLLALLRSLGFDQATGNPSRMSRLPGAARGDNQQRLLYLAPDVCGSNPIFGGKK